MLSGCLIHSVIEPVFILLRRKILATTLNYPAASSGVSQSSFPRRRESRHENWIPAFAGMTNAASSGESNPKRLNQIGKPDDSVLNDQSHPGDGWGQMYGCLWPRPRVQWWPRSLLGRLKPSCPGPHETQVAETRIHCRMRYMSKK